MGEAGDEKSSKMIVFFNSICVPKINVQINHGIFIYKIFRNNKKKIYKVVIVENSKYISKI